MAGFLNITILGVVPQFGQFAAEHFGLGDPREIGRALLGPTFLLLWIVTVMVRSPGATICLLEIRDEKLGPLSLKRRIRRGLPWLGCVGVFGPMSQATSLFLALGVLGLAAMISLLVDGVVLFVTGRSLYDRLFRVVVLQPKLPDHLKSHLFGARIS